MPDSRSATARSGVSIAPWVMSVTYLSRTAAFTAATSSSRSRRSSGSPPVKVTSIGLKKRAASANDCSSSAFASAGVFQ